MGKWASSAEPGVHGKPACLLEVGMHVCQRKNRLEEEGDSPLVPVCKVYTNQEDAFPVHYSDWDLYLPMEAEINVALVNNRFFLGAR